MRNNFQIYIVRVLKNTCPNIRITKTGLETIDSIIRLFTNNITERSLSLTLSTEKKTISEKEIETSCRVILPHLQNEIHTLAVKSIEQWNLSKPIQGQPQTREKRCGLIFSVSLCEKYIRQFNTLSLCVSNGAPIYLASALQILSSDILYRTEKIVKEMKRTTISIRHLFLSYSEYLNIMGFIFLEGGVGEQSRSESVNERRSQTKSRTLSEISRLQKTGDTLMQHAPFNNLVRELLTEELRLTADFCLLFQSFIEDRMICLMRQANKIANHSGRETVYERDISLALELKEIKIGTYEPQTHIPEAAIRHMALRAGIKRFGDDGICIYRNYMIYILKELLMQIQIYTLHHNLKTINRKILLQVLQMKNIYINKINE